MKRKILISPGFGAGWSSWNSGEVAKYMLTCHPIIDFLENGGKFSSRDCDDCITMHPLLLQLQKDCLEKFGEDHVCVLGARDLEVMEVDGRVRIHEYDGAEHIEEEGTYTGWM